MTSRRACAALLAVPLSWSSAWSQQSTTAPQTEAACSFDDGKAISLRYQNDTNAKDEMPVGKLWAPGKTPMYLFTQTELTIGDAALPTGAYSLYLIREKDLWTLVINRGVTAGSAYDEKLDVVRLPLQIGQATEPVPRFTMIFAHAGPKLCNLRIYLGQEGTWAEFRER